MHEDEQELQVYKSYCNDADGFDACFRQSLRNQLAYFQSLRREAETLRQQTFLTQNPGITELEEEASEAEQSVNEEATTAFALYIKLLTT